MSDCIESKADDIEEANLNLPLRVTLFASASAPNLYLICYRFLHLHVYEVKGVERCRLTKVDFQPLDEISRLSLKDAQSVALYVSYMIVYLVEDLVGQLLVYLFWLLDFLEVL